MKILLIIPKMFPEEKINYNYTFPLGICYVSTVMKKAGYDVKCLNLNHYEGIEKTLRKELENNYDIVMTGSIWMGFVVVKAIVAITRMYSPQSKIIIGGNLISSNPKLSMYELKPDFGVIGEGEETILELLEYIKGGGKDIWNMKNVKGICFISSNKLVITNPREGVKDIDSLPYPDLDSFEFEKYLDEMYTNQNYQNNILDYPRTYSILTARGCPFHCTFCYHQETKTRERSIDKVIEEIKYAKEKWNINIVNVLDDTFGLNRERVIEFCNKIKNLNLKWSCQMVVCYVDENLLIEMKSCGCYLISYGFESYDRKVLASMKKPVTPEAIDYVIKTTMKVGLGIQGNFIFGDIKETKETAQLTLDYWKKNCRGQIRLSFIQPYAGSEVYEYCVKKGIIKDEVKYMSRDIWYEHFFNMTESMSNEEINKLAGEIITLRNSGYFANVFPKQIFKLSTKEDRYKVEIDCPYCGKENKYENYFFKSDTWYKDYMMCRECGMRYNILKPI